MQMKKISVCDFTLRKLTQSDRQNLLFREKTAIASCIDAIGVDKMELPMITKEKEDSIIYKTIASVVKGSELSVPVGYDEKSVETTWECIKDAKKPCLQVVFPVSTAQMEYGFRMKDKVMLEKTAQLVRLAKEKCDNVEFVAQDATRADIDFVIKACKTAEENGASCVTVCDDAGVYLPEETAQLVEKIKAQCSLPLYVCLSDNINMAVAGAIAAVKAGADGVKTSMTGSDVLLTEKFAEAVFTKGAQLGIETSLKQTELHRDIKSLMKGINSKSSTDSAVSEQGGASDIFLDSQSSISDVSEAIKLLGYDLSSDDNGKVHKAIMQVCERKSSVGAKELEALIATYAMQAPSVYHLVSYNANCTNLGSSMAQITLESGEDTLHGVAIGDGPIDSAFRAIEQCIGYHYELDNFQVQAVTEGKEALGSALVRLRNRGRLYSGTGLSTDIVGASIRAYINALNKIVNEEK